MLPQWGMPLSRAQIQALTAPEFDPYAHDTGWFGSSIVKSVGKAAKSVGKGIGKAAKGVGKGVSGAAKGVVKGFDAVGGALGDIPVIGSGLKGLVTVTLGPYQAMLGVLSGERIDKAVLNNLKSQVGAAKAIAPYVQTVISLVPGVGAGISGGMSAALALAAGQPISEAVLAAAKGALPGGPLAAAAFDAAAAAVQGKGLSEIALAAVPLPAGQKDLLRQSLAVAKDIAAGKSVSKIALDRANANLKLLPASVQKAAQVGVALAQGKKIQDVALKGGTTALGEKVKFSTLVGATKTGIAKAVGAAPALKNGSPVLQNALLSAVKGMRRGSPEHLGFETAVRVLKQTSGNRNALAEARRSLPTEAARRSFDTAIGTVSQTVSRFPGALARRAGSSFVPKIERPMGGFSPYAPNLDHAIKSFERNPTLMTQNPQVLANQFGTSGQTVLQAMKHVGTKRLLPWRSLSPSAARLVQRYNPMANVGFLTHGSNDTAGLDESGTKYIVEKGDSPFKIALKLTGNGNRWIELKALNKDKKPTIDKNIWTGEVLNIPPDWQKPTIRTQSPGPALPSQPTPDRPTGTVPTAPQISVAPGIMQAKTILVAWSKSDGVNQAGVPDYGSKAEDLSTTFGPRDKLQLQSFQSWSTKTGHAKLVVDGILGPKSLAALQSWAEKRASQAATSAAPVVTTLPEILIEAKPPVTPTVVSQSPGLPPVVVSAPAAIPVAIPTTPVATAPVLPTPPVATPAQPATPATVAAASPQTGNKLGPALAGAAVGGTLFGLPGAILGGIAGAAMS